MTTTTSNTGVPGASRPAPVVAAPDPDKDPTVPDMPVGGTPALEEAPEATEESATEAEATVEEEAVEGPMDAPSGERAVETAAAEMKPVPGAGGDVTVGVVGDTTGWWVIGKSPRAARKLGPYGMMEAMTKANQLRGILLLEGKLRA